MVIVVILVTLLIFGVIVIFHEFGHFIIAKKNDILVEEFAIGMGPLIFSRQKGETLYSIRAFPIGGYCKMLGEDERLDDNRSFTSKSVGQRIAVCIAGVIMNIILAYLIVVIVQSVNGITTRTISDVIPDSPAQQAGLLPGDKIIKYNNQSIHDFDYLNFAIVDSGGKMVDLIIERDGQKFQTTIQAVKNMDRSDSFKIGVVGTYKSGLFSPVMEGYNKTGILETLSSSVWKTSFYVKVVLNGLKQLVTLNISVDDLAGPIGVGQVIDSGIRQADTYGIKAVVLYLLDIAALLSANLAVFNLLPIPALDGGRLVFLFIEGIRRKPIDPEKEGMVHFVGLMLLLILSVFVTFKDILGLF